jgi:tetratricopeptide (TPR) repeat protein
MPDHPVSKEEAMKVAHRIEYATARHDYTVLNNIFDEKVLSQRISGEGGLFMSKALIKGALEGFQQGQYGKAVVEAMGQYGTYEMIKRYEKDKKQHILFRLIGGGGVNYHDYELVKRDEVVKAADVYIYMSGENISKTIADALELTSQNIPKEDMDKINKVKTIRTLMSQGDNEKALTLYDELPMAAKKEKAYQLIHIRLCSKLGNDKYIQALNEYRSLFPKDPNMYLMMVDAYVLEKNFPSALGAVNKLDSVIDKDPYQDYERGLIYLLMKDTIHSQQSFERLHANMPKLKKGTIELMETYYYTHDEDKAAKVIREARDSNYLSQENLQALYTYHPDLKKLVEKENTKGN